MKKALPILLVFSILANMGQGIFSTTTYKKNIQLALDSKMNLELAKENHKKAMEQEEKPVKLADRYIELEKQLEACQLR